MSPHRPGGLDVIPIAYNTNGFQSHSVEDAARILADLGYTGIALTPDVHHLNPYKSSAREIGGFRMLLETLGLDVVIETGARYILDARRKHHPSLMDSRSFGRRQDFLKRCIDLAVALGAGVVSTWSGVGPNRSGGDARNRSGEDARNQREGVALLAKRLAPLCDYAAARDVCLAFEPEPGMFIENMAHLEALEAAMGAGRLGLTLDVGHARITESEPPQEGLAAWSGRIVNVHLDDVSGGRHVHLPPGEGEIDFGGVMAALEALDPTPFVSLELSRHSHDAVNVAAGAIEYLRGASGRPD